MNESNPAVDRRTVLRGVAVAGAAVTGGAVLAGCGGDEPTAADTTPSPITSSDAGTGGQPEILVTTADVPEGGGIILPDQEVVVTQPTAGEFVAFSTICTHQGCPVDAVENGTINCPCHGSMFAIADGAVVAGPAPSPLAPVEVTVDGADVVRA
ncbi:MAG TPA: Rieske (2Fe-2S) protein [Actinomycetes bacterium]|nr:Rieske (2Fe-2S) protein [Actinomycetes bacterium]